MPNSIGDNPFEVSSDAYGDRSAAGQSEAFAQVSVRTIEILRETRPWVQLMGVLLWIGTAMIVIGSLAAIGLALAAGNGLEMLIIGVVYLVMGLIYGTLARSLTTYASKINSLAVSEQIRDLEDALEAQKVFWKLIGIITLIMIILYIGLMIMMFAGVAFFGNLMNR